MSSEQEKQPQADPAEHDEALCSNVVLEKINVQRDEESSENQSTGDKDIEILDNVQDDDEDLHLEWDDDEIEDDIISLDIPPLQEREIDETIGKFGDHKEKTNKEQIDDIETVNIVNENIQVTSQMTESFTLEEELEGIQSEINNICADIKDNIDKLESIDDSKTKTKANFSNTIIESNSLSDDLILIDDDDDNELDDQVMGEKKNVREENTNELISIIDDDDDDEESDKCSKQTAKTITTKDAKKESEKLVDSTSHIVEDDNITTKDTKMGSERLVDSISNIVEDDNRELKALSINSQVMETEQKEIINKLFITVKHSKTDLNKNDAVVDSDLTDSKSAIVSDSTSEIVPFNNETSDLVTNEIVVVSGLEDSKPEKQLDSLVLETVKENEDGQTCELTNLIQEEKHNNLGLKDTPAINRELILKVSKEMGDNKPVIIESNNDELKTSKVTEQGQVNDVIETATDIDGSQKSIDKLAKIKIAFDKKDIVVTSSPNQSMDTFSFEVNLDHGLNKPDIMLEIPTQEVIEFLDDTNMSCDIGKQSLTPEKMDGKKALTNMNISVTTKIEPRPEVDKLLFDSSKEETIKELPQAMDIVESTDGIRDIEIKETEIYCVVENITKSNEDHPTTNNNELEEETKIKNAKVEELPSVAIDVAKTIVDKDKSSKAVNDEAQSSILKVSGRTIAMATEVTATTQITEINNVCAVNKVDNFDKDESKIVKTPVSTIVEPKPSTSQAVENPDVPQTVDSKDELGEVADSLGLLAESSRVMEDDEDPEDEEDDDDDFDQDQDESSNQMTAEHSEDSNAQQSESDQHKEQDDKETESPEEDKAEFNFAINDVVTLQDKDGAALEKDGDIDVDDIVCEDEVEVTPEHIGAEENLIRTEENIGDNIAENIEIAETVIEKPAETREAIDIETVKLSDTSDNEVERDPSLLRGILSKQTKEKESKEDDKTKPATKKLEITKTSEHIMNFVDLEESSSEDDVQEVEKKQPDSTTTEEQPASVDKQEVPDAVTEPKTPTKVKRMARINTSEISIRTVSVSEVAAQTQKKPLEETVPAKFGLEVFSLDSDEEDAKAPVEIPPMQQSTEPSTETKRVKETGRCINLSCKSSGKCGYLPADGATIAYYDATRKKRAMVCEECAFIVVKRTQGLVDGIKKFTPLLDLDITKTCSELVEISDSESEDEAETQNETKEKIGEICGKMLEEHLADMINQTWKKFKMDARLTEAQDALNKELKVLEAESKEIDSLLNECQVATDKLRNDLYATFEHERKELPPFTIYDTPNYKFSSVEPFEEYRSSMTDVQAGNVKRKLSVGSESPAKRPAIPLPYTPIDDANQIAQDKNISSDNSKLDDDKDIAVMQVSAEAAPSELPAPGELTRPPLKVGMIVYGMRNVLGSWVRCRILEVQGKSSVPGSTQVFTICKVRFDRQSRNPVKQLPARCLAYSDPADVRMTIGTRVIALFKENNDGKRETFYSGIIAEVPNPVNKYRYLIFFDDGYAQYVRHADTRLVCECSTLVWEEVHPFSREFVKEYLMAYPERPMVRLHVGQSLKIEWKCKWWSCRVRHVDASLVQVYFEEDNRTEWIYRGSTRLAPLFLELQAAERQRTRAMPRTKAHTINMPYVEYTRSDEQNKSSAQQASPQQQTTERETRQRAVAKKSTTPAPAPAPMPLPPPPPSMADNVTSRVVYYTPKNAVRPYKMVTHHCGPQCKRTDVLALKDLRTYNPLAKPLLSGWERQIVRFKGHKEVMYRAPCGRRVRNMRELHRYLRSVQSDMPVDLFDFAPNTHCLAEFVLNTCRVGKKDLSHGKENVPVPCVNYYDDSLPEFCSYNTERTPTAGVPLNLDPEFLCGCDCTDDCEDKTKCACWRMTLEGARTIGLDGSNMGYVYRRLPEPLPSGIYECNSRCKCKHTCLNRVAQHPLQLKLQVFKTLNRGWGIRALNDIPKGSFLCVYAGNLLTDATANMDGLNEGDEYLAELDYIEVVEQMKEGYEEDIPEADKKLDRKNVANSEESETEEMSSSAEEDAAQDDREDDDFRPGIGIGLGVADFSKRLRKREKRKQKDAEEKGKEKESTQKPDDDCITISDDEEVREPSRFMAQARMDSNDFKPKYQSVRSYFGKDEACYIMDAKVQGNIGRYLNHSCSPNVFVQNVFVDTHDPRFPWVAFFALCHIKAGTELTWNYNYDVGSVPGKILYCYCGAPNCRGRLL